MNVFSVQKWVYRIRKYKNRSENLSKKDLKALKVVYLKKTVIIYHFVKSD